MHRVGLSKLLCLRFAERWSARADGLDGASGSTSIPAWFAQRASPRSCGRRAGGGGQRRAVLGQRLGGLGGVVAAEVAGAGAVQPTTPMEDDKVIAACAPSRPAGVGAAHQALIALGLAGGARRLVHMPAFQRAQAGGSWLSCWPMADVRRVAGAQLGIETYCGALASQWFVVYNSWRRGRPRAE